MAKFLIELYLDGYETEEEMEEAGKEGIPEMLEDATVLDLDEIREFVRDCATDQFERVSGGIKAKAQEILKLLE